MKENPFPLCQPDERKGCCACCGLFNLQDLSRENCEKFLREGQFRCENGWRYQEEESFLEKAFPVRDATTHICPFQGFLSSNRPGCLVHPLSSGSEGRDQSLFGSRVCGNFLCPAYHIFSTEERKLLIESIEDWYLYTFAVIDPLSTQWIFTAMREKGITPGSSSWGGKLNASLALLAEHLAAYQGVIFCYSMPEYNLGSRFFSLTSEEAAGAGKTCHRIDSLLSQES